MKFASWLFVTATILAACSGVNDTVSVGESENGVDVIQAQDGKLYLVSCLRKNATDIANRGATALAACEVSVNLLPGVRGTKQWNPNYIVYYPPTFYSPSYQTNTSNSFCNYAFGSGWQNNCFPLFGYSYSYSYYYAPDCTHCLWSRWQTTCRNRCYSNGNSYAYGY